MQPLRLHSDIEVSIEYCTRSTFHTKHNPEKYADYFNEVKDALFKRFNHIRVTGNPENPMSGRRAFGIADHLGPLKDVSKPRLGSFEVTVTHGSTGTKSIFSKLESGRWPKPEGLVRAVERALEGDSLPPLTPRASAHALPGAHRLRVQRHPNLKEPRHPRSWVAPQPVPPTRIKDLKELSHRLYKKIAAESNLEEATEAPETGFDPLVIPGEDLPVRPVVYPGEDEEPIIAEVDPQVSAHVTSLKSEASQPEVYGDMECFEEPASAQDEAPAVPQQSKDYGDEFEEEDTGSKNPEERGADANDAARISDQSNGYEAFESSQEMVPATNANVPLDEPFEEDSGAAEAITAPQLPRPGEDLPEDDRGTTPPAMAETAPIGDMPIGTSEMHPNEVDEALAEPFGAISALAAGLRTADADNEAEPADSGVAAEPVGFTLMSADGPASGPVNPEQSSYVHVDPLAGHAVPNDDPDAANVEDGYEDDFVEDPGDEQASPILPTDPNAEVDGYEDDDDFVEHEEQISDDDHGVSPSPKPRKEEDVYSDDEGFEAEGTDEEHDAVVGAALALNYEDSGDPEYDAFEDDEEDKVQEEAEDIEQQFDSIDEDDA
jgi:selT/selW/selH-like putative selenoprotein